MKQEDGVDLIVDMISCGKVCNLFDDLERMTYSCYPLLLCRTSMIRKFIKCE